MEPAVERAPTIVDAPSPLAPASEPSEGTEESSNPKRRLLVYAAVVLSALAIWLSSLKFGSHKPTTRINGVARSFGDRPATIRLTGTTEAVHMRSIIAPILEGEHMGTLTLTKLVASGSKVHKGDILAEFDRQTQMRDFIDKQAQYEDLADKVIQEQAKEDAARAADETEIAAAKSNLGKAELESQKIELLSRIDAEKNEEALEEARATLKQLQTTFDLKRQSAHAGIHLLDLQRDRARQVMEHARHNSDLMLIRAPIDGVVVLNTVWKEGKLGEVQEGDQVRPGISFMQIVDPAQMQVRAFANQEDFLTLQLGQKTIIHLDAYPELVFSGTLAEMAPAATSGDFSSKLRKFAIVVSIEGTDPRLMPDLSAAVDIKPRTQAAAVGAFR